MSDPQSIEPPPAGTSPTPPVPATSATLLVGTDPLAARLFDLTSALPPDEREWVTARLRQTAADRQLLDDPTLDVARTPEAEAARKAAIQTAREIGRGTREESAATVSRRATDRETRRRWSLKLGDEFAIEHGHSPSTGEWRKMGADLPEAQRPPCPLGVGVVNRVWGRWAAFEDALGARFAYSGRGTLLRGTPGEFTPLVLEEGIELAIRDRKVFDINLDECVDWMRAANVELLKRGEPGRYPNSHNPYFRESGPTFHAMRTDVQARLAEEGLLPPMPSRKKGPMLELDAAWAEWEMRLKARVRTVEEAVDMHRLRPDLFPDPSVLDIGPLTPWDAPATDDLLFEVLRDSHRRQVERVGGDPKASRLSAGIHRVTRIELVARAREANIKLKPYQAEFMIQRFGSFDAALQAAGLPNEMAAVDERDGSGQGGAVGDLTTSGPAAAADGCSAGAERAA